MNQNRGHWYVLTGLLIGFALGLAYAWLISPLEYVDTTPASLRADFKDEYRFMIAAAHQAHSSLERTQARLTLLGDPDPAVALGEQAQRLLASNAPPASVRTIANLAELLQNPTIVTTAPAQLSEQINPDVVNTQEPIGMAESPLPTDATSPFEPILDPTETPQPEPSVSPSSTLNPRTRTPTATRTPLRSPTPIATATLKPSLTPTATPGQPFQLVEQTTFCEPDKSALLQVFLEDSAGNPAAGIELNITWLGGSEEFFSGLKPEMGFGYADFVMSEDIEYALSLSNGITRIAGLQAPICNAENGKYPGGIRLKFRQPFP